VRATILVVLLAGCYHGAVTISPKAIAQHAPELRARGEASVEAEENTDTFDWRKTHITIQTSQPVDIRLKEPLLPDESFHSPLHHIAIGSLLADCPSTSFQLDDKTRAAFPNCPLLRSEPDRLTVGHRRFSPIGAGTVITLGSIAGLGACAYACDKPYSTISGGTLIVGGVLVLAVAIGVIVYATHPPN
jgi:hypothetical protein